MNADIVVSARRGYLPPEYADTADYNTIGTWEAVASVHGAWGYAIAFSRKRAEKKAVKRATFESRRRGSVKTSEKD